MALMRRSQHQTGTGRDPEAPRTQSWQPVAPVVIVALLGLLLAGIAFELQRADLVRNAESTADSAAGTTAGYASETFADFGATLLTTVSLFDTLGDPTEKQFTDFTAPVLAQRPEVKAIQYSEWVPQSRRQDFERRLARAGRGESIQDPTPLGLVTAAVRPEYVAIRYNSPRAGNESVYGLDITYRDNARQAIEVARETGTPQTGGRILLAQGDGTEAAVTLYAPVYETADPPTGADRRKQFRGIVGIVMLLDGISGAETGDLADLALLDPGYGSDAEILWASDGAEGLSADDLQQWPVHETVRAPGRPLLMVAQPSERLLGSLGSWRPWALAASVLLLTVLLTVLTWKWMDARHYRSIADQLDLASRRLQFLAERDPLTGLPHREGLRKWYAAQREADPDRPMAMLFIDLDGFKDINTAWGHPTGDAILRAVAGNLADEFLTDASIAVRMGGDEFIVVSDLLAGPEGSAETAQLAQRALDAVNRPILVDGREFLLTASMGIALAPLDGRELEELLSRADLAVRRAKSESRGEARRFSAEMSHRVLERQRLITELRRSVRDPDQDFLLRYQPQVDMPTGRVVGLEALLRWRPDSRERASPDEFIPLAEQSGLMAALGKWVLRRTARQYAEWVGSGAEVPPVSVNVTAQQLLAAEFPHFLADLLRETPELRGNLEIEITEATAMGGVELGRLAEVRGVGVEIAIDDFGTGFSSLARLTEVPSQRVKIDQRFIAHLTDSVEALEVVRAIVRMAEALQLGTVAEGVEDAIQARMLADEGVRVVQGFLYSRPLPASDVVGVLRPGVFGAMPKPPAGPPAGAVAGPLG